jgi:hypothetical protein
MACAGLPVISDAHPTYARGKTPGMAVVSRDWSDWCRAIGEIKSGDIYITGQDYNTWEKAQPKPLKKVLESYLNNEL